MSSKSIKVISLDLIGTLVDDAVINLFWNDAIPRLYAKRNSLNFGEAKKHVLQQYGEVGMKDLRWYLPHYWLKRFELPLTARQLLDDVSWSLKVFEEVPTVLNKLAKKYSVVLSTGTTREMAEFILELSGIHFSRVFSCISDFSMVSKSEEFYRIVCSSIGVSPAEALHIGDNMLFDYEIPRRIGMTSYLLNRDAPTLEDYELRSLAGLKGIVDA